MRKTDPGPLFLSRERGGEGGTGGEGADGEPERPVGGAKKIHGAEERGRRAFGWSLEMQQ